MSFNCKNCNGDLLENSEILTINDKTIIKCSYCGSKFLIKESDAVKIQRIKSQTQKEIALNKQRLDAEKEKRRLEYEKEKAQKAEIESFKKSKLAKILIIFAIISTLVCILELSGGICLSGIIALAQTILYLTAWLMGMQIIKAKVPNLHILLFISALILMIPFFITFSNSPETVVNESTEFLWSDIEMQEYLPEPERTYGEIGYNTDTSLQVTLYESSKEDFKNYLDACVAAGYQIEAEKSSSSYEAFNSEGYKLRLHLFSYNDGDVFGIYLDAPDKMDEFEWPSHGIATLLPVTKSNIGRISWNNSETFIIHVGNTTPDEYTEYVKACEDIGFIVDYSKTDDYYSASNSEGYKLKVYYRGFNTIEISLKAPDTAELSDSSETPLSQVDDTTETPSVSEILDKIKNVENKISDKIDSITRQENTDSTTASPSNSSEMIDGMSKEFKEAMDSYEDFFDEYVSFMTKYADSGNPISMLVDYGKFMLQLADMTEKFEAWQEEDLSDVELAYYLEVSNRITQKLLTLD